MDPETTAAVMRQLVDQTRAAAATRGRIGRARLVEDLMIAAYDNVQTFPPEGDGQHHWDGPEHRGLGQIREAARSHRRSMVAIGDPESSPPTSRQLTEQLVMVCQSMTRVERARFLEDLVREVYQYVKLKAPEGGGLDERDGPERRGLGRLGDLAARHRREMRQLLSGANAVQPAGDDEDFDLAQLDPTEAHQKALRQPLPGDSTPIELTVEQAEKCLSIVQAYLDDHSESGDDSLWADPVRDVVHLLSTRALTARGTPHAARDPWPDLDALPWPPPAGLRP